MIGSDWPKIVPPETAALTRSENVHEDVLGAGRPPHADQDLLGLVVEGAEESGGARVHVRDAGGAKERIVCGRDWGGGELKRGSSALDRK